MVGLLACVGEEERLPVAVFSEVRNDLLRLWGHQEIGKPLGRVVAIVR